MDHFTGTKPVAASHAFDVARCEAPGAHLPGFAGPLTVEQFKGGQSNPTYKLITPGAQLRHAQPSPARWPSCCRRRMPSSASSAS
jgi:aminoglycoside phosphotransferase (APT) family kinase protein